MIRRSSWRTRAGSRKNAIILLRKCVRVPPLFWRYTHASENDCVTTRNSWRVSRNEQPAANVIIIVGHGRVMKKRKKERKIEIYEIPPTDLCLFFPPSPLPGKHAYLFPHAPHNFSLSLSLYFTYSHHRSPSDKYGFNQPVAANRHVDDKRGDCRGYSVSILGTRPPYLVF